MLNNPNPKTRFTRGAYPSYLFKEHDPILDHLDELMRVANNPPLTSIAISAGVTRGTLINWRKRKVKRPQFASVAAVINALGGSIGVVYHGRMIGSSETSRPPDTK